MSTRFQDDKARYEHEFLHEPRDPSSHNYEEHSAVYGRLRSSVKQVYDRNKALWDELDEHLDNARVNANDTVRQQSKDRPSQKDWDDLLTGSLGSALAFGEPSEKAKAHWRSHGIEW